MKLKIEKDIEQEYNGIDLFDGKVCTRSINDYNYVRKSYGSMIHVKVQDLNSDSGDSFNDSQKQ